MVWLHGLATVALFWACFLELGTANKTAELIIRVGASVGSDGPCAPLYQQTVLGYSYFFDWLSKLPPQEVVDVTGDRYIIRLQYRLVTHDCTEQGRAAALASLINGTQPNPAAGDPGEPPAHILLGGNGENALADAIQADAASRILIHCCTARDSVYTLDLPHVYGIFTPASMYTDAVLRTMAFSGVQRVAVVGSSDSALHLQLCSGAVRQMPVLGKLRPGFGAVEVINYTLAEASQPGFWDAAAARVAAAGADALVACDELERTSQLLRKVDGRGHKLSAVWMASYGNVSEFEAYAGPAAQYALTTVQWMPSLPYADPTFGTAEDYAAAFAAATGAQATYFAAAGTAAGLVLLTSLQRSVSRCNLSRLAAAPGGGGAGGGGWGTLGDAFMWQPGALSCHESSRGVSYSAATGQQMVGTMLSTLQMDTFFGPVGFNSFRQNIYHPPVVTQLLGGRLEAVIPLDLAGARLVLPIPGPPGRPPRWASSAAGIVIISLSCCLAAVVLALAAAVAHRRLRPRLSLALEVEIDPREIKVDLAPVRNVDGTFEAGEGTYRGTRVKLEVAVELLPPLLPPPPPPMGAGPGSKQHSPLPGAGAGAGPASGGQPQLQRSRTNLHQVTCGGGAPLADDSGTSPPSRPHGLSHVFTRRLTDLSNEPLPQQQQQQPTTPRSAKSQFNLAAGFVPGVGGGVGGSRRSRRQVSVLVWRALRMRHPAVCPVVGIVWEWPGLYDNGAPVPVVVRQWYELGNLAQLQENETVNLPLLTKASIVTGIAEGLAYLHAQEPAIIAGPILAHRVLIDKNFNPHLFLRLTSFDPPAAAAAAAATDAAPVPPAAQRSRLRFDTTYVSPRGTSTNGGLTSSPARSPQRSIAKPNQVVLLEAGGVGDPDGVGGGGGGASCAAAALDVERPSPRAAAAAAAADFAPPAPYTPSKAQDVLEFGRLLGNVFVKPVELSDTKLPSLPGGGAAADSGSGGDFRRHTLSGALVSGSGGMSAAAAAAVAAAAAAAGYQRERPSWYLSSDEQQQAALDAAMLEALEAVCPALAALVRSCLHPEPAARPTMGELLVALEGAEVRQSLTHGLGLAAAAAPVHGGHGGGTPVTAVAAFSAGSVGGGGGGRLELHSVGSVVAGEAADAAAAGKGGALVVGALREGSFVALGPGNPRRRSVVLGTAPVVGRAPSVRRRHSGSFRKSHAADGGGDGGGGGGGADVWRGGPRVIGHMVDPDDLLFDIFPPKVAHALRAGETVQPERYDCVSIFFSDVVGYTDLCAQLQPYEVMDLMHRLYSLFDGLCQALQLFKVETVGDAYLAVGNLRYPQPDSHARLIARFAFDAVRAANSLPVHPERPELGCVRIRVGLHCGPVVGSVVGTLNRRYCLFGDAVNTAARMEHNSEADRVHCSSAFATVVAEQWPDLLLLSRGVRHIKGKGQMETYWLEERAQAPHPGNFGLNGWCGAAALDNGGPGSKAC